MTRNAENQSPVKMVNLHFGSLYRVGHPYILGVPNDVILPPNLYRELLRWPRGIVTASMTDQREFPILLESHAISEHTPMAVGLIRRWVYDALVAKDGYFLDEGHFHYASDNDLALRIAACGIRGIQLDIPYYHIGSATLRQMDHVDSIRQVRQADRDRDYFQRKWGFPVQAVEYGERCGDINFRG